MAQVIGNVKSFESGTFFAKGSGGEVRQLEVGDLIYDGESVYGAATNGVNAKIVIDVLLAGAGDLVIGGNGALAFDSSLLAGIFSHNDAVVYVNSVKEALATVSPNEAADTTDAGETAAGTTVTDTERAGDLFAARTGAVGDVATGLLDPTRGGISGPIISDAASIVLNVVPTIGTPVSSSLDEEGLRNGNAGDSYASGDLDGELIIVTSQALNINWGTDAPASITFNATQVGLSGLTSGGETVNYTLLGGGTTVVGYVGSVVPTDIGDGSVVFYAKLNNIGSGTYDFALLMPLDHPVGATEDDVTMTFSFTATDAQGDSASSTFGVTVNDDAPLINVTYGEENGEESQYMDESSIALTTQDSETIGFHHDHAFASFAGVFLGAVHTSYGADGPGDTVISGYTLAVTDGTDSGLDSNGYSIKLYMDGNDVVGKTSFYNVVFRVQVDGDGMVKLTQYSEIDHLPETKDGVNDNSMMSLNVGLVTLSATATATDSDNDTATAKVSVDLGGNIRFEDDVPSVKVGAVEDCRITLMTQDANTIGFDHDHAYASFAGAFMGAVHPNYGADGPGNTVISGYTLAINGEGAIDSGLDSNGHNILLHMVNGDVVGTAGESDVFRIHVDNYGNITLTQYAEIDHLPEDVDSHNDNNIMSLANNLVTLSATATTIDGDNDTAMAKVSVDLGGNIQFQDDVPRIDIKAAYVTADALGVDETNLLQNATANFSDNFYTYSSSYGADGAGHIDTTYSLSVKYQGVNSGIDDVASGQDVKLYMHNGVVEGRISNSSGALVFTVSVDGNGQVTLDQIRAIEHPNISNPNDAVSLANSDLISLTRTSTIIDGDNDTDVDSAKINIGKAISFYDDGPSIQVASSNSVVEGYSSAAQDDVVLILDRSGSMVSSISSVKTGVLDLLNSGHVHAVFIASFAKDGIVENGGAWYNVTTPAGITSAMAAVDHVYSAYASNSGGTDYDAGLATVRANFTAPPAGGNRLISVFMSDGEPNEGSGGDGINVTEEGVWIQFLETKGFAESYAIGFGNVTVQDSNYLEPIAWTSSEVAGTYMAGTADANVMVLDVTQLGETLIGITHTPNFVSGELLSGASAGEDGWAVTPVTSATVNGETHIFTSPTDSHTFTLENNAGSVTIFGNGHYDFIGSTADLANNASGIVSYMLKDADGDTTIGSLTLTTTDSSEVYAYDNENGAQVVQVTLPGIPVTQILTDFSGNDSTPNGGPYNPWIFDHSGTTVSVYDLGSTVISSALPGHTDKWVISTQTGSSLDAGIEAGRLVIQDNNGAGSGSAKLLTPLFTIGTDGTTLKFDYERGNVNGSDSVTWQLYKQNGIVWEAVGTAGSLSASTSGEQTITSGLLNAGNYRIYFDVKDGGGSSNSRLYLDDIRLIVPGADIIQTNITEAYGNVLTDPNTLISSSDAWNAMDSKGSEGAALSILNGASYVLATAMGTTVDGDHGTLVIHSDGAYTYTPDATAVAGQQDTFTYMLTQPDGDNDTANLVINIGNTAYTAATPIVGVDGTPGADVILGSEGDDTLSGFAGNDHLEGKGGDDTLVGGDGNDILDGGEGNDTLVYDLQDTIINGGNGVDTIILTTGADINFGVLDSSNNPITNIEAIDLSVNGDHQLQNISHQDILDITGGGTTLTILGDTAADTVTVDSSMSYERTSTEVFNGVSYDFDIYSSVSGMDPTVTLRVENIITDAII